MENSDSKEARSDEPKEKLSISDFLEFMKISCQLNKIISSDNTSADPDSIDYNKLAANVVIKNVTESSHIKKNGEQGIANTNLPSTFNKKGLHPILEGKLDGILNEGILDSIIPFMCPLQPPVLNVPHIKQFKTKHRDFSQSPRVGSLQLLSSSVGKTKNEKTLMDSEKSVVVVQENNQKQNKRRKSSISVATAEDKKIE